MAHGKNALRAKRKYSEKCIITSKKNVTGHRGSEAPYKMITTVINL